MYSSIQRIERRDKHLIGTTADWCQRRGRAIAACDWRVTRHRLLTARLRLFSLSHSGNVTICCHNNALYGAFY